MLNILNLYKKIAFEDIVCQDRRTNTLNSKAVSLWRYWLRVGAYVD